MKTKISLLIVILTMNVASVNACLSTYQFKIFPVGFKNDTIYTVDFKIRRMNPGWGALELSRLGVIESPKRRLFRFKKTYVSDLEPKINWMIYAYAAKYDKNQNLISKDSIGLTYSGQKTYIDSLNLIYQKCYNLIIKHNPDILIFKPTYISFCDFQHSCDLMQVQVDTIEKMNYLLYGDTKYPTIYSDTTYYGFKDNFYHAPDLSYFYISSVRIYQIQDFELIISHLETGDELTNGNTWFEIEMLKRQGDYKKPEYNSKEYKPDIDFTDITNAIYEEPLLGHAYGFDLFLTKE